MNQNKIWAILVAGGKGLRLGAETPKQFLKVSGKEVFLYSLETLEKSDLISGVVLVLHQDYLHQYSYLKKENVLLSAGGQERQDSVYNGLKLIPEGVKTVLIHDAARPLLNDKMIYLSIEAAQETGAAVLASPCVDTIKKSKDGSNVNETLNRDELFRSETPQVFSIPLLKKAFEKNLQEPILASDEAFLVEKQGTQVKLAVHDDLNIKVTQKSDLEILKHLLGNLKG